MVVKGDFKIKFFLSLRIVFTLLLNAPPPYFNPELPFADIPTDCSTQSHLFGGNAITESSHFNGNQYFN